MVLSSVHSSGWLCTPVSAAAEGVCARVRVADQSSRIRVYHPVKQLLLHFLRMPCSLAVAGFCGSVARRTLVILLYLGFSAACFRLILADTAYSLRVFASDN